MTARVASNRPLLFGGNWTKTKLDIIERYLNAYTTALKSQRFKLMYIDAFAGTGQVEIPKDDEEGRELLRGSVQRALAVRDKAFDHLVLIEKDEAQYRELLTLKREHPGRQIQILNEDANLVLRDLGKDWRNWRGVLFLDPFGTQVDWTTIQSICRTNALDTWVLFPVSTIQRILPRSRKPDEISPKWVSRLDRIYGGDGWRDLYSLSEQLPLLGRRQERREPGVSGLLDIYRQQLRDLFGNRWLDKSGTLRNSRGTPLFELLFVVGNAAGIGPAKNIAGHLLRDI